MPRAMGKSATTTEFDHAVGRTVQRCDAYDPRCGFREEVVDKEETLRSSGGGGVDGNAQSSLEDCRVRMLLSCSSLQSQRICGGYWRWSDGTRALRATATFAQCRHHGRGRLECWYRLGCEAVEGMGRHRRVVAQGSGLREVRLDEVVP